MRPITVVALLVLYFSSISLFAQKPSEVQPSEISSIRAQLETLKADYDTRIHELELQVEDLQNRLTQISRPPGTVGVRSLVLTSAVTPLSQPVIPPSLQPPPPVIESVAPQIGPPSITGGSVTNSNVFNPDIAVIGDFLGATGSNTVNPSPVMEMHETEVTLQAIVDPYARADFYLAFGEEGVELEEGYLTFPAIKGGLLGRVGKMRAAFGKINTLHNHSLPWTDRPLMTTNLVGGEEGIDDAGFSVARLIPNPWFFLEATAQAFRGDSSDVYRSTQRSDLSYVGHLRGYQDITNNTNIDLGASFSQGHNPSGVLDDFDVGRFKTRLYGADVTIRWKPLQRAVYHSFIARSEFVWSRRDQPDGLQKSMGYYGSMDYQLGRRWFAGGRYDWSMRANDAALHDSGQSALLTFRPSEFNQIRGQYRRTRYAQGITANEFLFQFQFMIGAHGAHPF